MVGPDHRAGRTALRRVVIHPGNEHLERLTTERRRRAGVRRERADTPHDRVRGERPLEHTVGGEQPWCPGGQSVVLRPRGDGPDRKHAEHADEQHPTVVRETRPQGARVVLGPDLLLQLIQDGAGVETFVHPHHRHAGHLVTGEEG